MNKIFKKGTMLIYMGSLAIILGLTIFQDNYFWTYSALILGILLVLFGLRRDKIT